MKTGRITNWLLFGILLALLMDLGQRWMSTPAVAETFQIDHCVTQKPNEKPASYLHVVTHDFAGD
ncbi:MAG: hypothetical protein Q7J69_06105 [Candidatus Omnitrophota bacterium]|nr:hypothetical protein [Candidatus Omnitrophota bacterium]